MKHQHRLFLFLIPLITFMASAVETVTITRAGKAIQLDGFLIDWKGKERRAWRGPGNWSWDAINTTDGVAGYFRSPAVRCSTWTFSIDSRQGAYRPMMVTVADTGSETKQSFVCASCTAHDSASAIVIEWVIPWDSVAIDSTGRYAIHVYGSSTCGDTLRSLDFTGSIAMLKANCREAPGAVFWVILAVVFAAIAAALILRIRRRYRQTRTRRTESLRQ
jgi:hypothetical protein